MLLLSYWSLAHAEPVDIEIAVPPPPPEPPAAPAAVPAAARPPIRFAGDEVVRLSEPTRDAFAMGEEVHVEHDIDDNAFLMGREARVSAPVHGDVFAMGQRVVIDAPVGGEVYALGEEIEVTDQGSVGGDLLGGGRAIVVRGPVAGDVSVGAGSLEVAAPVAGSVHADVGQLTVDATGAIGGDLVYSAPEEAPLADGSVRGEVSFTREEPPPPDVPDAPPSLFSRVLSWWLWTGWRYAAHLLVGAAFLGVGGANVARVGGELRADPARALGIGGVVSAALLLGSFLCMALIVPLPLGFIGLATFAVLMYAAQVFAAQALGEWLIARSGSEVPRGVLPYVAMAIGLVPIVLLGRLPWFGTLIWLLATLLGVGALWMSRRRDAPLV